MDDLTIIVKNHSRIVAVYIPDACVQASWASFTKKLGLTFAVKQMFIVASEGALARAVAVMLKVPAVSQR